ncbi:bacterio-opsin activator [Halostella sp. JP-L12]|uniref:helix-turn-helix domain-containing protein n=1 Tax=Halostella TaxID=1843185 RepID=UPI000EF847D4|nr:MULTISPECIES: helix-turn-helix domain-containing protein [Halostella]NHN46935.1 bacterio-opsin activator [Halostella sp. JP-L12]
MATVVEFTVESDVFPLGSIFSDLEAGVTVELERVVPRDDESAVVPYFWVRGVVVDEILPHFAEHPGVRDIEVVDEFETQYLMRCEWVPEYAGILAGLTEADVTLLTAEGTEEEWRFEVRGVSQDAVSDFQRYTLEHEIPITVTAIHSLTPLETTGPLTDAQRDALLTALHCGYYDSPRAATMSEVADALGISQQALSSRLRRGTRNLIENSELGAEE